MAPRHVQHASADGGCGLAHEAPRRREQGAGAAAGGAVRAAGVGVGGKYCEASLASDVGELSHACLHSSKCLHSPASPAFNCLQ